MNIITSNSKLFGAVSQQDTPVLGHASRSTLLSAVCRSAGHVLATNAALSIEE